MSVTCGCGSPGAYAKCAGYQIYLTAVEGPNGEWSSYYADAVAAPKTGKNDATHCNVWDFCRNVVLCHRLPYYKDTPGDCPKNTQIHITGASVQKALGVGGAAAGITSGVIGLTTGVTGGAALAAGGIATLGAALGFASLGAGLLAIPFALTAHHDAAIALEQQALCAVSSAYNTFADQLEPLIRSGQVSLDQANTLADQMQDEIVKALASGYNTCNARCYYTYGIKALTRFCKERFYPSLVPKIGPIGDIVNGTVTQNFPELAGGAAIVLGLMRGSLLLTAVGVGMIAFRHTNIFQDASTAV